MKSSSADNLFIEVKIPIRRYLKKFIASHAPVEPYFDIKLRRCHFSALFLEPLERRSPKAELTAAPHLNDCISLKMGSEVINAQKGEGKFWTSREAILSVDYRLKSMFDQQLIDFITINNHNKGDIYAGIYSFMEYYKMTDDDIAPETLFKMYYRARNYGSEERKRKVKKMVQLQLELK